MTDTPPIMFRSKLFPVAGATRCACVIAGYRGSIASYELVVRALNARGYSAVVYEHDAAVLTDGDPSKLLDLVDQIVTDFEAQSAGYDEVICTGASIGAGLCLAVQRQLHHVAFGIYAGAGVSPPETVFEAPLFLFVRRKFRRNGYGLEELRQAWSDVDILPEKPFAGTPILMALGTADLIVKYDKAQRTLQAWQKAGQEVRIITKPAMGHIAVIRWYKRNFDSLLTTAEKFSKRT